MKKDKQPIAIVNHVCPCCGKVDEDQSELLIHKRFGDLSDIHNKTIGYGDFCKECQEIISKAVACVVVDESKTEDMKNPYRTGNIFGMSEDWCNRVLSEEMCAAVLKSRMFYMPHTYAIQLGLPVTYTP